MRTLHVVSHTHWDREWYQTFQQFRLRLVHLVDGLLELLEKDPDFKYFMLDGQTIVLDDYLALRPEQEATLRRHIQAGRIIIGPWHILPDMFLVGPEAHIRNLLEGERTSRKFGPKMPIGYIPDPFGHPGQVPQILRGFGIETACLWRGLDEQPTEFWWQAPDGSRVLMAYLRDSYSNGAALPVQDPPAFTESLARQGDSLAAHSAANDQLIMLGTDHMEPPPGTSTAIVYADQNLKGTRVVHSTLPQYVAALRAALDESGLPVVTGELRACRRMHLLPGVLSTRIWIKQRNHASESLLTKWAEPFIAFQELAAPPGKLDTALGHKQEILHQAWRLLMENHPHDSICGCSIDQVHSEMVARFDQVDQIGEELTRQALRAIAATITTQSSAPAASAIIVFNPSSFTRTDIVISEVDMPPEVTSFEIIDEQGALLPHETSAAGAQELLNMVVDAKTARAVFNTIHDGTIASLGIRGFNIQRNGDIVHLDIVLSKDGPDKNVWEQAAQQAAVLLNEPAILDYHVRARTADVVKAIFVAPVVPGLGWRTFYVRPKPAEKNTARYSALARALLPQAERFAGSAFGQSLIDRLQNDPTGKPPYMIENEFFKVEVEPEGTLLVTDKRTGTIYHGLNRFVDGGDCGDEYNYSPPSIDPPLVARLVKASVQRGPVLQSLTLALSIKVPIQLSPDRISHSVAGHNVVPLAIISQVSLTAGVARIDVKTTVNNNARDHRLRVHFPAPVRAEAAEHDGHFEIVRRKLGVPDFERETWIEDPRPEVPQRAFSAVSDGPVGLTIANRGLPEVEVLKTDAGTEIALTLLRCVGWLSRDDFQTRRGHAGPMLATPGAQMQGAWTFDYSVIPHHGAERPMEQAYAFETALRGLPAALHAGNLGAQGSFVSVEGRGFVISAVKQAENGAGWIVRGYNSSSESIEARLRPWQRFDSAARVNLAEQEQSRLTPDKLTGSVSVTLKAHEIVTILFGDEIR